MCASEAISRNKLPKFKLLERKLEVKLMKYADVPFGAVFSLDIGNFLSHTHY